MIVMFIGSFIVQYWIMSPIMVNDLTYVTNSIGKAYLGIIMGLCMVTIEVMMHDHQYNVFSVATYSVLFILIGIFITLYKKQYAINDTQYLREMMEHHSMALLTSEEILKKTDDYNITKLAKNIIQNQMDELHFMNGLLNK